MTKRKTYSKESKLEALRQLELGDRAGTEITRDLDWRKLENWTPICSIDKTLFSS